MSGQTENSNEAGDISPASSFQSGVKRSDPPHFEMTIWPNRSMPISGFRRVIYFTAGMLALPLISVLGTPIGWVLLPFLVGTLCLLWFFIGWNYRDGKLNEVLKIWPDLIEVVRTEANGSQRSWHANPFWVQTDLKTKAKIESYLTLKGNGREIELGAFLSPEERIDLKAEVDQALLKVRTNTPYS